MPRFDLKDRTGPGPVRTTLHPGGRERVFDLPYDTEDPGDIALLRKHPLLAEIEAPEPDVVAEAKATLIDAGLTPDEAERAMPGVIDLAKPEPKPKRPSRKEVDD